MCIHSSLCGASEPVAYGYSYDPCGPCPVCGCLTDSLSGYCSRKCRNKAVPPCGTIRVLSDSLKTEVLSSEVCQAAVSQLTPIVYLAGTNQPGHLFSGREKK